MNCVEIKVYGKVQGVGFRYRVKQKADEYGLTGYVMNSNDGGVNAFVCGEFEHIEQFIHFCELSPGESQVKEVSVHWVDPPQKPFQNFEIRLDV